MCNEDQSDTNDGCTLNDSCTCPDCWGGADPVCADLDYCHDDGDCFSWWEGCHCADCVNETNCQGYPGTGGAGGAGGNGGNGGSN